VIENRTLGQGLSLVRGIPADRMRTAGAATGRTPGPRLLTVGHGTASREELAGLLHEAGVEYVVDVRSAPGSRRFPQFRRAELEMWLPAAGIGYRWEPGLGGFRKPAPGSPHVGLRHPSFRAYADYMATDPFRQALARVVGQASRQVTAVMCAETLWWRCHRRLIADAATILSGAEVWHIGHDGRLSAHQLTPGVRRGPAGTLIYDGGQSVMPGSAPAP
jgi:uncharacterized protein (DUF488 family)